MALLERTGEIWIWRGDYDTRRLPRAAGFKWIRARKRWEGPPEAAAKLAEWAHPADRGRLDVVIEAPGVRPKAMDAFLFGVPPSFATSARKIPSVEEKTLVSVAS